MAINVTVWNEFRHEKTDEEVKSLYPDGIHVYIKSFLDTEEDFNVTVCSLDEPDQGLPNELIDNTDVLIWWGHIAHAEVSDELVTRLRKRVYECGMGFIPLHSAHHAKPFKAIIGTTGNLTWGRNQNAIVWSLSPTHPIADGVPLKFALTEELYSEPFYIPRPDDVVFATWFEDGNLFRGGVTFTRGIGKIFYFHPGHETCASFKNPHVQRIIKNAIRYCKPVKLDGGFVTDDCVCQPIDNPPYPNGLNF